MVNIGRETQALSTDRKRRLLLLVIWVWVGMQISLGVFEWSVGSSRELLPDLAVIPLIAAAMLIVGLSAFRAPWPKVRRIAAFLMVFGALYQVSPIIEYFGTLSDAHTYAMAEAPLLMMSVVYILTPVFMLILAAMLFRTLPIPPPGSAAHSSFVHRTLVESEQEWKPELKPSAVDPVRMTRGLAVKLAILFAVGALIVFGSSLPLSSKAGEFGFGWYFPFTLPDVLHFNVVHPAVMFLVMFVIIAALWKSAAHKRMGRILLRIAIATQTLILIGLLI